MAITNVAIGADQVWAGAGDIPSLTGQGITVAVTDSGIDTRHYALRNRVIASVDFTGGDGVDRFGHGTHVAGIIAGQTGGTLDTSNVQGVARGAYLVSLRVLGDDGSGTAANVIKAIDWAIEHRKQYDIGVINLSLGAPVLQPYADDPLCEAMERAVASGIVVVAAAGNFGKTKDGKIIFGGITSSGNDPHVLTVGALDTHGTAIRSDDTVATYSSRGPTLFDMVLKPDVVAPGSHIVSAEAAGSYLSKTFPECHVTGAGPGAYMQLSGTSMAAGVVSGTAALLLQLNRRLKPAEIKAVVQLTSTFMPEAGLLTAGTGRLNALAAAKWVADGFGDLPSVRISGQRIKSGGITTARVTASSIIWSSFDSIIWSSSLIWGNSIIWSSSDSIIWSSSDSIIWSSSELDI